MQTQGGSEWTPWIGVISTVIGVVLGYLASRARDWLERRRIRRGQLAALKSEVLICSHLAEWYLGEPYMSPAYRVPLVAYGSSLPALLSEGILNEEESAAVMHFYVTAKSFNLCLDLVQEARGDADRVKAEVSRARIKAAHLVPGNVRRSQFDDALAAIAKHLPKSDVGRLSVPREVG